MRAFLVIEEQRNLRCLNQCNVKLSHSNILLNFISALVISKLHNYGALASVLHKEGFTASSSIGRLKIIMHDIVAKGSSPLIMQD